MTFLGVFFLGVFLGVGFFLGDFDVFALSSLDVDVVLALPVRLVEVDILLVNFFSLDCGGIFQLADVFPVVRDLFVVVDNVSEDDLLLFPMFLSLLVPCTVVPGLNDDQLSSDILCSSGESLSDLIVSSDLVPNSFIEVS